MKFIAKPLLLMLLYCCIYSPACTQNLNWLVGTWKGSANINKAQLIRTIIIDSVGGNSFSGTRSNQLKGKQNVRIETALTGSINDNYLNIKNGNVLYQKAPPNGEWMDCSDCNSENKISVEGDKLVLTSHTEGCKAACNNTFLYYKSICDFDSVTQQYLIKRFGKSGDLKNSNPCKEKNPELIAEENTQNKISDSLAAAKQKEQQRIKDEAIVAAALAKKREKEIADSISFAKKQKKQMEDSLITVNNIAKQKEQQRIKDEAIVAAALAKKREKQIADSISIARKREKQMEDSLIIVNNIAKQKEQQRIKDEAIVAAALAKKRDKQIADSISIAKKREKQMQDSLITANNITKQKEQQRIKDSITNSALLIAAAPPSKDTANASTKKALTARENVVLNTYHIATPDILIELFDNAQIDGDRVTVYHNGNLIVNNKTLMKEPIVIKVHADAVMRQHEFTMIAENLGTIPPNTALMRVTIGGQVYKLSVRTDLQTNAKIVFYYDGN